ncbi:MAG: hypothetical protein P0119_21975 [Nitrospira sp.]|nr:hypothetical protein [Nitrospira sp.]
MLGAAQWGRIACNSTSIDLAEHVSSQIEQRSKLVKRQPCLSKHLVKQPLRYVALVLMADPDSQDRPIWQEFPPRFVFFRSKFFKAGVFEYQTEIAIRERGHA